jgi:hypothetical protein
MFSLYQKIIFKVFLNFFMIFFIFLSIFSLIQGIEGQLSLFKIKRYLGGFLLTSLYLSLLSEWVNLHLRGDIFAFELWGYSKKLLAILLLILGQSMGLFLILIWGLFINSESQSIHKDCLSWPKQNLEICWQSNDQMKISSLQKEKTNHHDRYLSLKKPKSLDHLNQKSIEIQGLHVFTKFKLWCILLIESIIGLLVLAYVRDERKFLFALCLSVFYMGSIFFLLLN